TTTKSIFYNYRAYGIYIDDPTVYVHTINGVEYNVFERLPYVIQDWPNQVGCASYFPSYPDQFEIPSHIETAENCNYSSSWLLTKITSSSGDWINFTYNDNGTIVYESNRSFSANVPDLAEKNLAPSGTSVFFLSPVMPYPDVNLHAWMYPL